MRLVPVLATIATLVSAPRASAQQVDSAPKAPPPSLSHDALLKAQTEGREAGGQASSWFGRSLVIGLTTGLVGTGVTYVVAANKEGPRMSRDQELIIAGERIEWRRIYENAYVAEGKRVRKRSVLIGGLVGTGIFFTIFAIASAPAS